MSPQLDSPKVNEVREGDVVGGYTLGPMLGEGGMGRVFRATAPDGSTVALKVARPEMTSDEVFRRRFDREGRATMEVDHPNVVRTIATGEDTGVLFLAQEFVEGEPLSTRIEREGALPLGEVQRLVTDLASGLEAIHAAGLVHRDLKPANVLLDADGRAFIVDFGLAKDTQASVLTRPGQALGTMDYMAPEQIRGEPVGPHTDVYALGCIAYECLCGKAPFADKQGMQILWAHLQDEPPDLAKARADLEADLCWAVCRALEKEPEGRPQSPTAYARFVKMAANMGGGSQ